MAQIGVKDEKDDKKDQETKSNQNIGIGIESPTRIKHITTFPSCKEKDCYVCDPMTNTTFKGEAKTLVHMAEEIEEHMFNLKSDVAAEGVKNTSLMRSLSNNTKDAITVEKYKTKQTIRGKLLNRVAYMKKKQKEMLEKYENIHEDLYLTVDGTIRCMGCKKIINEDDKFNNIFTDGCACEKEHENFEKKSKIKADTIIGSMFI